MIFLWAFLSFTMFLPILDYFFDPLLAFSNIWGQIAIDWHMLIYKLCKHAKNCTHKRYFYEHF